MYMKTPRARLDYWRLVEQWQAIVGRDISKEAKQAECMAVLCEYVDTLAWGRIRGTNRAMRFHADMLVLHQLLTPLNIGDELGQVAVFPAYRLVDQWLREHSVA